MAESSSASALMFHADDQTDEDFFDKLVNDEFEITGFVDSHAATANSNDPGNLSVGSSGFAFELEDGHDSHLEPLHSSKALGMASSLSFQKDVLADESVVLGKDGGVVERTDGAIEQVKSIVFEKVVPYDDHPSKTGKEVLGLPDSSKVNTIDGGSTSIKEVQWSAFTNAGEQTKFDGFGSYLDFIAEESSGFADKVMASAESSGRIEDSTKADSSTTWSGSTKQKQESQFWGKVNEQATAYSSSLLQQDGLLEYSSSSQQQVGQLEYSSSSQQQETESSLDPNDPNYWEKLYPGWKYDFSTGQWYQVTVDSSSISQLGDSGIAVVNAEEGSQTNAELACRDTEVYGHKSASNFNTKLDGYEDTAVSSEKIWQTTGNETVSGQTSDVSYQQQTVQSVITSVAESSTVGNIYDWNNVTQEAIEYPPNMIFDPQYPGWYYDTNTQEWKTLESYMQSTQLTAITAQNQFTSGNSTTSDSFFLEQSYLQSNDFNQFEIQKPLGQTSQEFGTDSGRTLNNYSQQNIWQPEAVDGNTSLPDYLANQKSSDFFSATSQVANHSESDVLLANEGSLINQCYDHTGASTIQGFVPAQSLYHYNQPKMEQSQLIDTSVSYYGNQATTYPQQSFQSGSLPSSQFSYSPMEGRSSAHRPPHALVSFGFGGKIVIMKNTSSGTNSVYANQDTGGGTVSILNLTDVIMGKNEGSDIGLHGLEYFHTLCKQSFPGPLVGGNAASKDLNKWIEERISICASSTNFRKGEILRLLLSLMKVSLQYYGKLRSPFGTDPSSLESDSPESAVTKLFASSRKDGTHTREYGAFTHCMHNLPTEGQIRATAAEVQTLLVSGKRKEALQCAQEGMLWGPALVLAAQLGEKFYIDTVKQMAHRQFLSGSPLRTLCLLIAGQPADVFSDGGLGNSFPNKVNVPQQPGQVLANGMLDDWEENLAIICANRTKDDELVIVHLGDCLWKERGEITAAHTCYLVAEANFESYSDSARLCLIGADHWNCPRTYASPEAIQRTEFYEYSKVLGNSQFQLLTFQPYKLIYAYMLAEVGKVSDSLRYCQTILKLLKNPGRSAEVELWKAAASSLEERLRMHQQGGYGTSLAPAKLVGKLFTSIDKSIHRMIGAPPPPLPSMPENKVQSNEHDGFSMVPKVTSSQSTTTMTSLMPSASVEAISEWSGRGRHNMQNRSVSEPDFGRTPKESQVNPSNDAKSVDEKTKASSSAGSSRFGSLGSSLFQKTIGWVSRGRTGRQAKLGQENKFYYDEKLKRWVEEGAEMPPEEAAPPPPPTTSSFQNGVSDYNINSALKSQNSLPNGEMEAKPSTNLQQHSGIPPIPTSSQNQFSARGRMGVRSRYVDTFNKTGGAVKSSFQASAAQSIKPIGSANAKFFVPSPVTTTETAEDATESVSEASSSQSLSSGAPVVESSFSSLSSPPPSLPMQRFPSMDTITSSKNKDAIVGTASGNGSFLGHSRAASWSGSFSDPTKPNMPGSYTSANKLRSPLSLSPDGPRTQIRDFSQINGGGFGDDLHEVEL